MKNLIRTSIKSNFKMRLFLCSVLPGFSFPSEEKRTSMLRKEEIDDYITFEDPDETFKESVLFSYDSLGFITEIACVRGPYFRQMKVHYRYINLQRISNEAWQRFVFKITKAEAEQFQIYRKAMLNIGTEKNTTTQQLTFDLGTCVPCE